MIGLVIPDAIRDRHDGHKWNAFLNDDTASRLGSSPDTIGGLQKMPGIHPDDGIEFIFRGFNTYATAPP